MAYDLDICFKSEKERKLFNSQELLSRKYGHETAKKIRQRLDDLHAADTLEDMRKLPGRCHELTGNERGKFAVDLPHPRRLLFTPNHNPIPEKPDGGIDWSRITVITILGVVDYHGRKKPI